MSVSYFVVFPYIRTRGRLSIRGIELRSSTDMEGLPEEAKEHLRTISAMFYLRDDFRIREMTYTYLELPDGSAAQRPTLDRLLEVQTIIGYFASLPDPERGIIDFGTEYAAMFLFWPQKIFPSLAFPVDHFNLEYVGTQPIPEGRATAGYEVHEYLRREAYRWVVPGNRIYAPSPRLKLAGYLNLADRIMFATAHPHQYVLHELMRADTSLSKETQTRMLTALDWHNRSTAIDALQDEAIVALATAFESLLLLDKGTDQTNRFKETIMTLLGTIERLDDWVEQFYEARSKVLHEGRWLHFEFYPKGRPAQHDQRKPGKQVKRSASERQNQGHDKEKKPLPPLQSLTSYGWIIFRMCLVATLSGALQANESRLSDLFTANQERLVAILNHLDHGEGSPADKLAAVTQGVRELGGRAKSDDTVDLATMITAGRKIVRLYFDTEPTLPAEIEQILRNLTATSPPSWDDVQHCNSALDELESRIGDLAPSDPLGVVRDYLNYVSWWSL